MAIIRLRDLRAASLVGIYERERAAPQPIIVHVEMAVDAAAAIATDDLAHAVDYEAVATRVRDVAADARFYLLEPLTQAILDAVLAFPGVQRATVRVQKPQAIPDALVEVELSGP